MVKLFVLALDYDGTLTRHETLDPGMRDAIAAARTAGITVILVTGRILSELQRVAGDLHFVDAVVAENGAIAHFPATGYTAVLGQPAPAVFVDELRARGLAHQAGQCLVDAAAADAPKLLEIIRRLELPLVLVFNAGRVMTLAQGISKATGLHAVLDMLRLSAHNTLAIGDAENDHELLRLAEIGAAVEWGSAALRAAADTIVAGTDPSAVAAYIRGLARAGTLPRPPRARRRLRLGYTEAGREFSLAAHGRNVLIAGDAKSGKSWVAGLLCEQLILLGYCVCVLDPEGDYASLEGLPGVTVLGGADPPPTPRDLARALRFPDRSVVIDLSRLPQDQKIQYVRGALPAINEIRRRTGLPHRVVVDEAHYFLHEDDVGELLDFELSGYTFVTYWASRLPPALLAATEVIIVTRETSAAEIEALRKWCGPCAAANGERWAMLTRLETAQALALPITAEAHGDLVLFTLGPRMTAHVRHREKYVDVPVSEDRAFVFAGNGAARRVRTLRRFVAELERPAADLSGHLTRGDFSRWVGDVFGDHALADDLRAIEQAPGAAADRDVLARMANAIRARYDLAER